MSHAQETAVHHVRPGEMDSKNRATSRAIVIGPVLKRNITTGTTKEVPPDDLLHGFVNDGRLIEPPFDQLVLAMLTEHSSMLGPCIDAMETNIDGFGFTLESRVKIEALDPAEDADLLAEVKRERVRLTNFFNRCCVDDSFTALRRKTRKDLETTGNAYWEIIRSPLTGIMQGFNHLPSHTMRLGVVDECFTEFTRNALVLQEDDSVQLELETVRKRFRRFAMSRHGGGILSPSAGGRSQNVRWFKEFGDPRVVDNRSGEVVSKPEVANLLPEQYRASEVLHWKIYSSRTPYGLPRHIGQLLSIFGDRASEEINFVTLRNNNIPSMALMVSNGQLTEGTIKRITDFVESQIQGSDNYSRFLIVEAEGSYEGQDANHIRMEMKPLTDQQMRDQMFLEYQKNNGDKIRRGFRLPPIFIGATTDYNKATAEESRKIAEEQIFKPERDEFDAQMNKHLMTELGARYHRFVSRGPNVTDDQDLISVLMAAERTGALSPRIARTIVGDVLNQTLPEIDPAKLDPDIPFSIQMANAAKNLAATQTGSPEVGSQVTALKGADVAAEIVINKARAMGADALVEVLEYNRDILVAELKKRIAFHNTTI